MIKIDNLKINFGSERIFNDFSLNVERGEKIAITGKSGAGKSTLLNLLAGFVPDFKGRIVINGIELNSKNIVSIRQMVAWLPQETSLDFDTVKELFYIPFGFEKNKALFPSIKAVKDILKAFELEENLMSKNTKEISGGQKQRIILASCMLLKKPILVVDEPTSALDFHIKKKITDYILNQENITVLCSTHDDYWIESSDKLIKLGE